MRNIARRLSLKRSTQPLPTHKLPSPFAGSPHCEISSRYYFTPSSRELRNASRKRSFKARVHSATISAFGSRPTSGTVKHQATLLTLEPLEASTQCVTEDLTSKNVSEFYDRALMAEIGQRLLRRDGPLWQFYDKGDIEAVLSEVSAGASKI